MDPMIYEITNEDDFYFRGIEHDSSERFHAQEEEEKIQSLDIANAYGGKEERKFYENFSKEYLELYNSMYPLKFSYPELDLNHRGIMMANVLQDHNIPSIGSTLTISEYSRDVRRLFELEMPKGIHDSTLEPKDGKGCYNIVFVDINLVYHPNGNMMKLWWMTREDGMLIVRTLDDPIDDLWKLASHYRYVDYIKPITTGLNNEHFIIFSERLPENLVVNSYASQKFIDWLEKSRSSMFLYNNIIIDVLEDYKNESIKPIFNTQLALIKWLKHLIVQYE